MKNLSFISLLLFCLLGTHTGIAVSEEKPKDEKAKEEKAKASKNDTAVVEPDKPKIYLKLEPSLVMNVEEKDVSRFLQADVQLQFTDPLAQPIIEKHMPAIRHTIIMVISGSDVPKIKTSQGKEDLRVATVQALQKTMTDITGEPVIEEVYFTGFIIQ